MEALNKMTNLEKGKLLAALFPDEIKGILNTIRSVYKDLCENKVDHEKNWNHPFISLKQWNKLGASAYEVVRKNVDKTFPADRFAKELLDGVIAIFTGHCIIQYAESEKKDTQFWYIVQALFKFIE